MLESTRREYLSAIGIMPLEAQFVLPGAKASRVLSDDEIADALASNTVGAAPKAMDIAGSIDVTDSVQTPNALVSEQGVHSAEAIGINEQKHRSSHMSSVLDELSDAKGPPVAKEVKPTTEESSDNNDQTELSLTVVYARFTGGGLLVEAVPDGWVYSDKQAPFLEDLVGAFNDEAKIERVESFYWTSKAKGALGSLQALADMTRGKLLSEHIQYPLSSLILLGKDIPAFINHGMFADLSDKVGHRVRYSTIGSASALRDCSLKPVLWRDLHADNLPWP